MTHDLGNVINQLLYNRESVVIPGLGTLVASYKSASIDHVQGLLHAPSKQLSFDETKKEDDDVLIDYICEKNQIEQSEAAALVAKFVKEAQVALEKKEILVFEKVGRLYRDYEHKLQFLQDNTNFNTQTYGLPSVQFYPVLRNRNSIFEGNEAPGPVPFEVQKESKASKWKVTRKDLQNAIPAAFFLLIAFSSVYFFVNRNEDRFADAQKVPVVDTRINEKPTLEKATFMDGFETREESSTRFTPKQKTEETETVKEEVKPAQKDEDGAFETELDTESVTVAPTQKSAVIIIGAFSKKAGVRKRIKQIYELGYDAYQDKYKNLTRVGIQFAYETEREKQKILSIMREEFVKSAYFLND